MTDNIDPDEVAKFDHQDDSWWQLDGPYQALHAINPLRLGFIDQHYRLDAGEVLDVGCGGGILAEAMALCGASVTGLDQAEHALEAARLHGAPHQLALDYQHATVEAFAQAHPQRFDAVTCMEMLEHVPDPASIVTACVALTKPGGWIFLSTLNRTLAAKWLGIHVAERWLGLLPEGTHEYDKFIRPAELAAMLRSAGADPVTMRGMSYQPLSRRYVMSERLDINYLVAARKPAPTTEVQ